MARLAKRCTLFLLFAIVAALFAPAGNGTPQFDEAHLSGLKYRPIGPFRGGRTLAAVGVPGNPLVYYFGAVSGGVWKTLNGGITWEPIFDHEHISSIGSIALAESDPNVIYVGTGEACIRGNISYGDGVYKSVDAGKSWTHIGLQDTRHIGAVIVDPHDPDIVLVAALGHAYGPNTDRGVFRSADGGRTWTKVLFKDANTGAIDVVFDPSNSRTVFAALWEARRTPWSLTSGGPGSGLYKSTDGGSTWKRIEGHGFPEGVLGRIGVSVSGADSNRIYALVEAEKGGLYASDDGGDTWELVNDDHRFRQRAWYYTHVFADPKSADTVYVLNTGLYRSLDGGKKFARLPAPHGDHHDLWIDPTNPDWMINANDGGATITHDGGTTWTTQDNQPTAQFYHVAADTRFPYNVYGAQQDRGTVAIASDTDHGSIDDRDGYAVGGGESGYVAPDPANPDVVYAGSYFGILTRFDKRTGQAQLISPWPDDTDGFGAASLKYRFTWTQPIAISPHDPNVLYFSSQVLFRSADGGMNWTEISPDLSRNDKAKQQSSGGPITKENASAEYYDLIFSVAESPVQKDLIWAGTDDGLVHVTRDGGTHWASVTPNGMPRWSLVSSIDASPHDAGTAYIAVDAHKLDDFRPYIFRTHNFGKSWKKIVAGIPDGSYAHVVREDPEHGGLLLAGTETGVYLSFDDGEHWRPLQLNLPPAPVHDLAIYKSDLLVATHGRSFWILDDIEPLRELDSLPPAASATLFKPRPAVRFRRDRQTPASRLNLVGQTAPAGATIYYWLKDAPQPSDEISLEILDPAGQPVRRFTNRPAKTVGPEAAGEFDSTPPPSEVLPAQPGVNRFVWDMRYERPREISPVIYDEGDALGAFALPGAYQLKLKVGDRTYKQLLEVRADPRTKVSPTDLQKQFELVSKIRDLLDESHAAVLEMRDVRAQLQSLRKRFGDDDAAKPLREAAQSLEHKIAPVEEALVQGHASAADDFLHYPIDLNSRLGYLQNGVDSADAAPTQQDYDVEAVLEKLVGQQLALWKDIREKDLADLNDLIAKNNIPEIGVGPSSATDQGR